MHGKNDKTINRIYFTLSLLAALALTVTGIVKGDPAGVLAKAVKICMEGVGIG